MSGRYIYVYMMANMKPSGCMILGILVSAHFRHTRTSKYHNKFINTNISELPNSFPGWADGGGRAGAHVKYIYTFLIPTFALF